MRSFLRSTTALVILTAVLAACSLFAKAPRTAEEVFLRYGELEGKHDPSMADLFCDDAKIRIERHRDDGQRAYSEPTVAMWRAAVEEAKARTKGEKPFATYSNPRYTTQGQDTLIRATRFDTKGNYSTPFELVVGKCQQGHLGIKRELSIFRWE